MKIVQINTVCGTGSTGKIAVALHNLSVKNGYESYIAYGRGVAPSDIPSYKIGNPLVFIHHVLINFFKGKSGFGSKRVTLQFIDWLDEIQPDIIHIHNLHGFYLNIDILFRYIKKRNISVAWTLHDCWSFTGQCAHFDYVNCNKWQQQCYQCPIYRSNYPYSIFKDNSIQNYIEKKAIFNGVTKMILVTPSIWLSDNVSYSFLNKYPITVIPNGINLDIFRPYPRKSAIEKQIVLGVANVWTERKGYNFFLELSKKLNTKYQLVLIGVSRKQQKKLKKNYPQIISITRTQNQLELAQWYSDSYVYLNPTLEDTFPTTNLEALACGTPVITFRTGGSPEAIANGCGFVVEKGNLSALENAIYQLEEVVPSCASACRAQAMHYQDYQQFSKYLDIYRKLTL